MEIIQLSAPLDEVLMPQLTELFDDYRVYYGQPSDRNAAATFLRQRLEAGESVIFLVKQAQGEVLGFTQLYPMFSSVSIRKMWVLNDLFVAESARGKGAGTLLLRAAQAFCQADGAKGLALETHHDNPARFLYEREGWVRDEEFLHFFWQNT